MQEVGEAFICGLAVVAVVGVEPMVGLAGLLITAPNTRNIPAMMVPNEANDGSLNCPAL